MNKAAAAMILLASLFVGGSAAEIEVRLVRFTNDVPPPAEILRLNEADQLPSVDTFIAEIDGKGAFMHSAMKPLSVREFDEQGQPAKKENRFIGNSVFGKTTRTQSTFLLDLVFRRTELKGIRMERAPNGTTFPKPVFHNAKIPASLEVSPGVWSVVTLGTFYGEDAHSILLVVLRR